MDNLNRIEIENFQSIDFLSVPLSNTGVHWVNGKPNVGKSAVLKAVQALFTNVSNNRYKEMIRDGEDAFRVKGYFSNGDWVELIRGEDDRYSWVIDGQAGSMAKTQGKVPFELKNYYGLYWTGDKIKRNLNFTLVGDQLFFVETSSGDNTLILEKALGTDRLTRVGQYADSEKKEVRSELKTIRAFHEESDKKLERLAREVDEGEERLNGVDRLENTLKSEIHTYDKLDDLVGRTLDLARIAQAVQQAEESLANVDVVTLQKDIKEFGRVNDLYDKKVRLVELAEEEESMKVNISHQELTELEAEIREYGNITSLTDKLLNARDSYERLQVELKETEEEYEQALNRKEEFLAQFDVCPFCDRPMGDNHGGC